MAEYLLQANALLLKGAQCVGHFVYGLWFVHKQGKKETLLVHEPSGNIHRSKTFAIAIGFGFIINRSLTLQQQRLFKSFSLFALFYCLHYVLYFLLFLDFQNRNFKEMRKPYSDINDPCLQWLENDFPTYLRKWKEVVDN